MTSPAAFPLYDTLIGTPQGNTVPDWKKICVAINNLPDDQLEVIYALIIHHAIRENTDPRRSRIPPVLPPYGGKTFDSGKGVLFKLNNIPIPLQGAIAEYVKCVATI